MFECYQSQRIYSAVGKDYDCSQNKHALKSEAAGRTAVKPDDYNVRQSKIAIGSGGLLGKGFLKGTQTRGKYVPEQHTDFIFTSIGEAFGFIGCFLFLGIYFVLLFRIVQIAERQRSSFSRVYAYSVASILFFHIVSKCLHDDRFISGYWHSVAAGKLWRLFSPHLHHTSVYFNTVRCRPANGAALILFTAII